MNLFIFTLFCFTTTFAAECADWNGKYGVPNFNNQVVPNNHRRQMVLSGGEATANEYPWFASIDMGCGAFIVARQYVVRAAHCFLDDNDQFVSGPYILYFGADSKISIRSERVIMHPQFNE